MDVFQELEVEMRSLGWAAGMLALGATVATSVSSCGPNTPEEMPPGPEIVTTEWDDMGVALTCPEVDDGTNCLEPFENAIRVDDEVRQGWMDADLDTETQSLRVRLMPGATLDPRIQEGTILYRGRHDRAPLMHRVRGVRTSGDMVEIRLERVSGRDTFRRGRIRARVPARARGMSRSGLSTEPLTENLEFNCEGTLFDTVVASPLVQGHVTVDLTECSFGLTFWVDVILRWDNGILNLDRFEVVAGGAVDASLHAAADLQLTGQWSASKTLVTFAPIPITIGGLVITITPSLHAGASTNVAATVQIEHGFDYHGSIEEGFGWSDRRGFYSIDNRESEFTQFGPNVYFDGELTARVYLEPRVDVEAFGMIGGFVTVEAFAEANLTSTASLVGGQYQGELCADLSVGLQPSIGAAADIAGFTLFEEEFEMNPLTLNLVENACTSWTGAAIEDCDPGSPCCNDGQCPDADDPDVTVTCERGSEVLTPLPERAPTGMYRYSCEQHHPEDWCLTGSSVSEDLCDDGNDFTVDECVDNRCLNYLRGPVEEVIAFCPATAPDCCFVDSDCADGVRMTIDTCVKDDPEAGPDVRGTCTHETEAPMVGAGMVSGGIRW
jgi:hypothetical protein